MFLQGYHSQSTTNYWNLALNPYGQYVTIGDDNTSLFNAVGSNSDATVVGNTSNTSSLGNSDAAINIVNTNGTAGNTAGFTSRAKTQMGHLTTAALLLLLSFLKHDDDTNLLTALSTFRQAPTLRLH